VVGGVGGGGGGGGGMQAIFVTAMYNNGIAIGYNYLSGITCPSLQFITGSLFVLQ